MAYEIFDDVAFYYMFISVISVFLFPWTLYKVITFISYLRSSSTPQTVTEPAKHLQTPAQRFKKLEDDKLHKRASWLSYFTFGNLIYILLLALFIYVLFVLIPAIRAQPLASFDPYTILEIDSQAPLDTIKRAYRRLSLQYHPDKHPDDPEAGDRFIAIAKAYETLTSPQAMENIEKYGHPDGYRGMSVTIGLPSFLTNKQNETKVLLGYFIFFLVIPPVCLLYWFSKNKNTTETGIMIKTLQLYSVFAQPNFANAKFLIEVLSWAGEFEAIVVKKNAPVPANYSEEFIKLLNAVKEVQVHLKFSHPQTKEAIETPPYVRRASVLLHAYLLREHIPDVLLADVDACLKHAPLLCLALLECSLRRGFFRPAMTAVQLTQMIIQGMWVHSSPLYQLPHVDEDVVRKLQKKNIKSVFGLRRLDKEKRLKVVPQLTEQQWEDIDAVIPYIPEMDAKITAGVEDEPDIFEEDIIVAKITLERLAFDASKDEDSLGQVSVGVEQQQLAAELIKGLKDKKEQMSDSSITERGDANLNKADDKSGRNFLDENLSEQELADAVPMLPKRPASDANEAPLVHSLYYPHEKRERWYAFLLEMDENDKRVPAKIIGYSRVPPFMDKITVDMMWRAAPCTTTKKSKTGEYQDREYELWCLCDSYVGCDIRRTFTLRIQKQKKDNLAARDLGLDPQGAKPTVGEAGEGTRANGNSSVDAEEVYNGKWYYFGLESFWELLLNIFVLALLCVFLFNFLHSRGYWQLYVQPSVDFVGVKISPVTSFLAPYVNPIAAPVATALGAVWVWLVEKLHSEPEPMRPLKRNRKGGRVDRIPVEDDYDHGTAPHVDEDNIQGMGEN